MSAAWWRRGSGRDRKQGQGGLRAERGSIVAGGDVANAVAMQVEQMVVQAQVPAQKTVSQALPPRQLPTREALVGDATALDSLCVYLRDVPAPSNRTLPSSGTESQSKLVVVHGQPGVGKSTLALNAAHKVKDAYPDGQIYVDLHGGKETPRSSADALGHMLSSLHVAREDMPDSVDDRAAMFRSLTVGQRLLVLLDSAHSTDQIEPLLPTGAGCSVLITSRRALSVNSITQRDPVPVHLPDDRNALAVLSHYAGQERIAAEMEAAIDIIRFCGNLPLALRLVGCKLKQRSGSSLGRMRVLLEDERSRLDHLKFDTRSLTACFIFSFQGLTPTTRSSFAMLASLPAGRLTDWHFVRLEATRGAGLVAGDELVEAAMMETQDGEGGGDSESSYRVHDLIRVFAARQYEELPPEEGKALEERLVRAYRDAVVHWAAQRAPELRAEVDPEYVAGLRDSPMTAAEWVAGEQDRLCWAIDRARNLGLITVAAEIGEGLSYFLDDITLAPNSADWIFNAPGETRSRVLAGLRRARARAALAEGNPDRALSLLVLDSDDAVDGPGARDVMVVARAHSVKGDYRTALDRMTVAVDRLRTAGDSWHTLGSLELLGELQRWRGKPELGEQSQREALRIAEQVGDLRAQARLRRTLAETLGYLRRPSEAAPLLESARDDFRLLGDRRWEGATEYALGKIYRLLGERQKALDCYSRAEGIFGPMGERLWVSRVNNARIRVLAGMGQLDDAVATAREAIALFEQLGNEMWVAHTQRDVGWLHLRAGRPQDAEAPLTRAVDVCAAAGDAYAGAMARHLRGVAYRELGQYPEARADFDAALEIYRSGSYEWNEAAVAHDVIRTLRAEGRTEEADIMERDISVANPIFDRMHGRDGAVAVPDED
ncbi:tetratricopeptide repeat protein [Streptomyces sp. NPDC047315]|uniref:tetratricopeptide repeat protein n=1 Tax=Streptomyces sp. NPDC047315 TaxID=3155142 RepID=UPI0033FDAA61